MAETQEGLFQKSKILSHTFVLMWWGLNFRMKTFSFFALLKISFCGVLCWVFCVMLDRQNIFYKFISSSEEGVGETSDATWICAYRESQIAITHDFLFVL